MVGGNVKCLEDVVGRQRALLVEDCVVNNPLQFIHRLFASLPDPEHRNLHPFFSFPLPTLFPCLFVSFGNSNGRRHVYKCNTLHLLAPSLQYRRS